MINRILKSLIFSLSAVSVFAGSLPARAQDENISSAEEEVIIVPEQQAEFPGGMEALMKFLGYNIRYPEKMIKDQISGKVIVQFTVGKDGTISDPKILRSVSPEADEEAKRLVMKMPKWQPGMQNGQPVASRFTLPITFNIQPAANSEQ